MARITRKNQTIFAGGASNNGQFGSAQLGTKLLTNDIETLQALPAWENGWDDATISAQNLPPLEEFQALDYINTYQLTYLFQEGIPEWDTLAVYFINSIVKKPGTTNLYFSLTDNNTGNALTDPTNWSLLTDFSNSGGVPTAVGGGTVDAITATFATIALVDRQLCVVRATGANTATNPSFSPNSLTAHTITKLGGQPLAPGDIPGANADIFLCYDLSNTRWELLNPSLSKGNWCIAGGAADVITGTYTPAITALYDGLQLFFRAANNNVTTTPTFAPNGLTAHVITKKGGGALAANDIPALGEMQIRYNLANTRWELYNPESSTAGSVSSVDLTGSAILAFSGGPITSSGAIDIEFATQTANKFFAGPSSGGAAVPTFRILANADLPTQGGITPGAYPRANVTVNQQGVISAIATSSGSDFTSSNHAIVNTSSISIAHGLGAAPSLVAIELVCDTPEYGYNAGDIVQEFGNVVTSVDGIIRDFTVSFSSTNIYILIGAYINVANKSTGAFAPDITNANWHCRVRAWK